MREQMPNALSSTSVPPLAALGRPNLPESPGDRRVYPSVKKFGPGRRRLAPQEKAAGGDQENRDRHTRFKVLTPWRD
jgi:hypothetical protein